MRCTIPRPTYGICVIWGGRHLGSQYPLRERWKKGAGEEYRAEAAHRVLSVLGFYRWLSEMVALVACVRDTVLVARALMAGGWNARIRGLVSDYADGLSS